MKYTITNISQFDTLISSGFKLVIFHADWCRLCANIIDDVDFIESNIGIDVATVHVENNRNIMDEHDVKALPCFVLFKNGDEVSRYQGSIPKEAIVSVIKEDLQK